VSAAAEVRACPTCRQPREVYVRVAAKAVRICPDCGDRKVMLARNLKGQTRRRCTRCANARKAGGRRATPRDDVDEVMVDRIMGGRDSGANIAERLEAAARLLGLYRLSRSMVAERLGVTTRTVDRYIAELRATDRLAA